MVAAKNIRVDLGVLQFRLQPVRGDKVVNTPTGILLSGVEHIAPPAVYAGGIRVKVAESIGKSAIQQGGHFASLFIGKTGVFVVGLWILQVDLPVGHIQVATEDHRFVLIQGLQISKKVVLPLHTVVQPG